MDIFRGLEISEGSSNSLKSDPLDLNQDTEFTFTLEVNDGFCSTYDEVKVASRKYMPVADGGGIKEFLNTRSFHIVPNGSKSFDQMEMNL